MRELDCTELAEISGGCDDPEHDHNHDHDINHDISEFWKNLFSYYTH